MPRSALTFSAEGDAQRAHRRRRRHGRLVPVAIVEDARDEVWVAGPSDGARIIVQGQDFVKDGQKVGAVDAADAAPRRSQS